jgi:hypothetical protein
MKAIWALLAFVSLLVFGTIATIVLMEHPAGGWGMGVLGAVSLMVMLVAAGQIED